MSKLVSFGFIYSIIREYFPGLAKIERRIKKTLGLLLLIFSLPFMVVSIFYIVQYWPERWIFSTIILLIGLIFFFPGIILYIWSFKKIDRATAEEIDKRTKRK
jgi:hypothetical protein